MTDADVAHTVVERSQLLYPCQIALLRPWIDAWGSLFTPARCQSSLACMQYTKQQLPMQCRHMVAHKVWRVVTRSHTSWTSTALQHRPFLWGLQPQRQQRGMVCMSSTGSQSTSSDVLAARPNPLSGHDPVEWLSRTHLLIGSEGIDRLAATHVLVVGLGGVGSFAAEVSVSTTLQ